MSKRNPRPIAIDKILLMPDDPIAKVQALVGCPHKWVQVTQVASHDDVDVYLECVHCKTKANHVKGPPQSAPDCSTLWGALQAAQALHGFDNMKFLTALSSLAGSLWLIMANSEMTELEVARAVCELILQALQAREK